MKMVAIIENDSVGVVNVLMNNMENYLPNDVIEQEREMWVLRALKSRDCNLQLASVVGQKCS